ncbi:MAG: hypothetical protein KKH52_03050, partial [Nanoarchaeota archaeon]|nr:hypothetical protein [Nanoarchaeota archaeon]
LVKSWKKLVVSSLVLFTPVVSLFYFILKIVVKSNPEMIVSYSKLLLILFFFAYYLLLVSFAFIQIKSWKTFIKKTFSIGIKKIYLTLPLLIFNYLLIMGNGYLIFLTVTKDYPFIITFFLVILFITIITLTRIFWIACLNHEKNNHRY